ncbi:MAG: hypothetical protein B0A82_17455 [Alkalinema sp. CACIAM 70d]|nr:MAG: hypothetical protein B0A82_17455 [Alkalinema sp. CACIAM 70d]
MTFCVYVLLGVLFFGGLGIWAEVVKYYYFRAPNTGAEAIITSLTTYFPALVGAASLQLMFENRNSKPLLAFAVLCLCVLGAIAIWLAIDPSAFYSVVSCVAAIWIWWIANARAEAFRDDLDIDTPLGGNPGKTPPGSLQGFNH